MIFFDLLVLLTFVWFSRKLFQLIKFPPLFGEVFAGILAGPLILGVVGESSELQVLAELGIFFLMFHAGLETHPQEFLKSTKKSVWIALGGILLPLFGGFGIAYAYGYDLMASWFVGISLSVTAVAITARLFKDTRISKLRIAHVVLSAAIITEIVMLIVLTVFLDIAQTGTMNAEQMMLLLGKVVAFFALTFFVGQKLFPYLYAILYKGNKGFTFSLILALAFGVVAEALGLHMIVGAFLAGLFLRKELIEESVFNKIEDRVFGLSYSFLGPIFFASLAFHLTTDAFRADLVFCLVLLLVAVAGKILGSGLVAHWLKMKKPESLAVGLAMNSRGEVDLIIIALGFQHGIIDANLFSLLVVVAFATTLISIMSFKPLAPTLRHQDDKMTVKDRLLKIVT